ncbi:MAG: response regulator transcription factor [Campylobacterota bacterium]|nr:response regulator transcription factor [Campylobacterota bacterium]
MSTVLKKILLVEDDIILGETIQELLESESYEVIWAKDGQEALDHTFGDNFDLLLLDVNIPFINGFELLNDLRQSGDITPAIFLTANTDIDSLKKGFDVGADDYIKKPFNFDEFIIRIEAVLQRSFKSYSNYLEYGDLKYDIKKQLLTKDDKVIHLTPTESKILEHLLQNIDKIITFSELTSNTSGDFEVKIGVLRVQISKLKKLGFNITNIRQTGYRLGRL